MLIDEAQLEQAVVAQVKAAVAQVKTMPKPLVNAWVSSPLRQTRKSC